MSDLHTLKRPRDIAGLGGSAPGASTSTLANLSLAPSWIELPGVAVPAGEIESEMRTLSIPLAGGDGSIFAFRSRIELGEGAVAAVLVRYVEADARDGDRGWPEPPRHPALLSTALDIELAARAHLKLYVLSGLAGNYFRETFDRATLGADASLEWIEAQFDTIDGIHTTSIDLEGAQSSLSYSGAYAARSRTEREHILAVRHLAPRTKSRSILKSALKESAHLIFRGLIRVDPKAPGTDAYLSNRNLVLEDGARAESLPQLQIDNDDVACSHGATTGGPRPEELFYLMSRGLDREDAKRILVQGHLGSIFTALPDALAEEFEARATDALSTGAERSQA